MHEITMAVLVLSNLAHSGTVIFTSFPLSLPVVGWLAGGAAGVRTFYSGAHHFIAS